MPAKVLDSFALINLLRDEPGAETVENLLVTSRASGQPASHDRSELRRGANTPF